MTAKNDHTGSFMNTKAATDAYREGFERIFGKKEKVTAPYVEPTPAPEPVYEKREMSDREWAAQPANLREGCTVHVPGVGDL